MMNGKANLLLILACLAGAWLLAGAQGEGAKAGKAKKPSNKDLYLVRQDPEDSQAAPKVKPTVKFWAERAGAEQSRSARRDIVLDTRDIVFRSGDRVWVCFQANVNCHAYLICQGSTGAKTLLFPGVAGKDNEVPARKPRVMPSVGVPFQFDEHPGKEQLALVISPAPIPQLDGIANPNRAIGPKTDLNKYWEELKKKGGYLGNAKDLTLELDESPADQETPGAYVTDHGADGFSEPLIIPLVLRHEP